MQISILQGGGMIALALIALLVVSYGLAIILVRAARRQPSFPKDRRDERAYGDVPHCPFNDFHSASVTDERE